MKKLLVMGFCLLALAAASASLLSAQKAEKEIGYTGTLDPRENWAGQSVCWNYRAPCPPEHIGQQGSQN